MSSGLRGLTQLKEEKHDAHIHVHLSFFMTYTEVKWEECFSFNAAYCLTIFSVIPRGEVRNCYVVHELRITNQVIYLNPPIEDCRYKLYQEMFAWKMVILSLPRIQSQRYQVEISEWF